MKLIITNSPKQHKSLLEALVKVLRFKISKFESDLPKEDKLLFTTMEESKNRAYWPNLLGRILKIRCSIR